jgi:hypothetical protein
LDKEKATQIIRQMSKVCGIDLRKSALMLMPPNAEGIASNGDQLHVQAELDFGTRVCLYAVMDEHQLKFKEKTDKIVIYSNFLG